MEGRDAGGFSIYHEGKQNRRGIWRGCKVYCHKPSVGKVTKTKRMSEREKDRAKSTKESKKSQRSIFHRHFVSKGEAAFIQQYKYKNSGVLVQNPKVAG